MTWVRLCDVCVAFKWLWLPSALWLVISSFAQYGRDTQHRWCTSQHSQTRQNQQMKFLSSIRLWCRMWKCNLPKWFVEFTQRMTVTCKLFFVLMRQLMDVAWLVDDSVFASMKFSTSINSNRTNRSTNSIVDLLRRDAAHLFRCD